MQGPIIGEKVFNWKAYEETYEVIVYDKGQYAVYNFDTNGLFGRRTKWHSKRSDALREMLHMKATT